MSGNNGFSSLQLYPAQWHAGLTESNHLAAAYATEPEVIDTMITRIFAKEIAPIQYLTSGMRRKKEISNNKFRWYLEGDSETSVKIIANLESGNTTPGKYRGIFRIVVEENDFAEGNKIVFDDGSRARVQNKPWHNGQGYVLECKITKNDPSLYIDPAMIATGKELSIDYTTVGEFSEQGGKVVHSHPFQMENHLTTVRLEDSVSRSAATDVMIIEYSDPANPKNRTRMWTRKAEWDMMYQWYNEMEKHAIYSEYSANSKGITDTQDGRGMPVYEGAGLREQISPSNQREYNELNETILSDFLTELSWNTVPEDQRHFVAFTGEYGFKEFDNAMKNKVEGTWQLINDNPFIDGRGRNVTLGGQFKTYIAPNGISFTLKKMPMYDNAIRNRQKHYKSGKPLESYRFTIFDFGLSKEGSNIQKVYKQNSEMLMWHVGGSIDPYGNPKRSAKTQGSNSKDGYSVFMLAEVGYQVKNPAACGELICVAAK